MTIKSDVKWADVPERVKSDIVDWLSMGNDKEDLINMLMEHYSSRELIGLIKEIQEANKEAEQCSR
jgi:hypothetical protein